MPGTTPRWGLPFSDGADLAATIDDTSEALATALDSVAMDDQGTLALRPTSTVGSPGEMGRYYFATDDTTGGPEGTLYRDTGTSWVQVRGYVPDASVSLSKLATEVLNHFLKINGAPLDAEAKWLANVAASNTPGANANPYAALFPHGLGRVPLFAVAQVEQPYTGSVAGAGVFVGRPTWDATNVSVVLGPLVAGSYNGTAHANLLVIG